MLSLVVFLTCIFIAVAIGLLAAWSDIQGLTIPNWHSGVIIVSFLAAFVLMHLLGHAPVFSGVKSHLLAGIIIFGITALLFGLRVMGAADSKLSTAFAFWVGIPGLPAFLFYTTLIGGVMGLASLIIGRWKPFKNPGAGGWIARVQAGENKVPYGVAIALGALATFVKLGYFGERLLTLLAT